MLAGAKKIYKNINNNNTNFVLIAVETSGAWCSQSAQFIEDLGKTTTTVTSEPFEAT